MRLSCFAAIVVLVACGPSESGEGGGSSSSGSESTGATTPTTSVTSSSVSDTLGTMSDSMSASMSDSATMTTTMTSDATETSASESTGPADSGSSGPADTGSSSSGSDSGSTGGSNGIYDPCAQDDPQCADGQECQNIAQGDYNFCTIMCDTEDDCPPPSSGDATVNCGGPPMQPTRCQLACVDGETCPDGMECVEVGGGAFALCAWPS